MAGGWGIKVTQNIQVMVKPPLPCSFAHLLNSSHTRRQPYRLLKTVLNNQEGKQLKSDKSKDIGNSNEATEFFKYTTNCCKMNALVIFELQAILILIQGLKMPPKPNREGGK
ncbi:hypothetical protein MN116_004145 [Schistosoma mekongi]|uniref:Uncharacterized protein n=1 Tax=Schistosoma mekongi TaxID=38744 RepID=A0AAE1ZGL8_SCHME|nr:hypothetical protein MN116_004145 [Schistosoma mekongi]